MNKEVVNAINKPMSMVREEFVKNLISLINTNNLPLFVTESILRDLLAEVSMSVKEQERIEKAQYEQMLKEQLEQMANENSDETKEDK